MKYVLKPGDRVKMTDICKQKMRGKCQPGKHVGLYGGIVDLEMPNDGCLKCSLDHVEEFGSCTGVVEGLVDYNNCPRSAPEYDPSKVGPEYNVRWQPSNLRYGYHPCDLRRVE